MHHHSFPLRRGTFTFWIVLPSCGPASGKRLEQSASCSPGKTKSRAPPSISSPAGACGPSDGPRSRRLYIVVAVTLSIVLMKLGDPDTDRKSSPRSFDGRRIASGRRARSSDGVGVGKNAELISRPRILFSARTHRALTCLSFLRRPPARRENHF